MKPYWQSEDERLTIYHGDCREVLPLLEPGSVDLVLADPPYGIGYITSMRLRGDPLRVKIVGDDFVGVLRDALPLLDLLLKKNSHAYVFASPMRIGESLEVINDYWASKSILVWDKGNAGTVGDLKGGYGWNWEAIIYAQKGRRLLNGPRPRTILRYAWSGTRDAVHPAVKPVALLRRLVHHSSALGELIIDPFMGSGTTLRAAKDLGRRAIGIEIEEKYCRIAVDRLRQEVLL